MSTHWSKAPRLACALIALATLLCLVACTAAPAPDRTTSRTEVAAAVDYAAMEAAIENKIRSGSLSLSTINAVLVSVGGETSSLTTAMGASPTTRCTSGRSPRALSRH